MSNKILIVEDEFVVANGLRLILKQAGYNVCGIAASADEAEHEIQKHHPDVVLIDIRLDGKRSGIELAKKIKADNIAFIYLSANSSQKVLEEAKETEPYGFLVKPFREKDVLVALDIAFYRHKHIMEAKLRQEQFLKNQLVDIRNEIGDAVQGILKITKLLQSHIPNDLLISGRRPHKGETCTGFGYLRTGADEYQVIGNDELIEIVGLTSNFFFENENLSPDGNAYIYNSNTTNSHEEPDALHKKLFDHFKIESNLIFPVALNNGNLVNYFFYSRQRGVYMQDHIALLNRLKTHLKEITEKFFGGKTMLRQNDEHHAESVSQVEGPEFENIIGKHPLLLAALDLVKQVAPYNTSVLILGESGTGKERIAEYIHLLSNRKAGPFVKVNCGTIPSSLVESELFGHEKGAFTGATEKRKGKFEQANGGTIFLDEVGELTLEMQVKLLRVLQEKEIDSVGGSATRKIDVRVVAATNRNLEKEISTGNFRLDLYYRLNIFPITLPPLRQRKSDIDALALYFVHKFCKEFNKEFMGIAQTMLSEMHAYDWPGNIRELENVIERSVILHSDKSELSLKQNLTDKTNQLSQNFKLTTYEDVKHIQQETERKYIISILKKTDGRIRGANGAAELLDIKPTTLESKIAKLGIKREDLTN
ncbi:sigma 54-interacting response regulator [Mucilaginibacter aquaedulcis]|uniref:sigma 54-interacting response regulator n=1 Tax=Mucilaginibacter aquaedulcis TaxID=1187081 RepID=UPI0025B5B727|nr:sigma 54-interacting response regulator [Mucilaginibacter aquaedulcis]MDN3549170.1 sigma 54-interacting response regulator [Mucilaginibacter aquaedulcis]